MCILEKIFSEKFRVFVEERFIFLGYKNKEFWWNLDY